MELLQAVLLMFVLITAASSVRIQEGTSRESSVRRLPVTDPEYSTLPFDIDDDYLSEFTGVDEKHLLDAARKENVTIEEIFGKDTNTAKYEDNSVSHGRLPFNPDVNATVTAVEKILANNPYLPKLSRREILEIFANITTAVNKNLTTVVVRGTDMNISDNGLDQSKFRSREEYARALMLVMPFSAKDMSDPSVQELYTKPPITHMIPDADSKGSTPKYENLKSYRRPYPKHNEVNSQTNQFVAKPGTNLYRQIINKNQTKAELTSTRPYLQRTSTRHPVERSTAQISNRLESTQQFVASTKSYRNNKPREAFPTMRPVQGHNQIAPRLPTARPKNQSTQRPLALTDNRYETSESANRYKTKPTADISEVHPYVNQYQRAKLRKPNPGDGITKNNNYPTAMHFNRTTEVFTTPTTPRLHYQEIQPFRPLPAEVPNKNKPSSNALNPVVSAKLRKHALGQNNVDGALVHHSRVTVMDNTKEQPEIFAESTSPSVYMTPSALRQDYNDAVKQKAAPRTPTPVTPTPVVRNDIRDVLASLGLFPDTNENPGYSFVTTKAPTPDISVGAGALSPDFQEMLKSFGLLPTPGATKPAVPHLAIKKSAAIPPKEQTPSPNQDYIPRSVISEVDSEAYASFRPIPAVKLRTQSNQQVSEEMQQFLASFGLGPGEDARKKSIGERFSARVQKSLNTSHDQANNRLVREDYKGAHVNMDILTDDMREVLENLGLVGELDKPANEDGDEEDELLSFNESTRKDHIFNPVEQTPTQNQTDEVERLNRLLETVKTLANDKGSISQEEKLAKLLETVQFLTKTNDSFTQQDIDELNAAINLKPLPYFEKEEKRPVYVAGSRNKTPLDHSFDSLNPIEVDKLINMYIKNEIKRQEPKNDTVSEKTSESSASTSEEASTSGSATSSEPASTTEAATSSVAVSTTEAITSSEAVSTTEAIISSEAPTSSAVVSTSEAPAADSEGEAAATIMPGETEDRKPSFAELADSFGGGETAEDIPSEIETPPSRPNGLYFLLDWNTFLQVGEEGKGKVDVKIGPKVGNPKNFLTVSVP